MRVYLYSNKFAVFNVFLYISIWNKYLMFQDFHSWKVTAKQITTVKISCFIVLSMLLMWMSYRSLFYIYPTMWSAILLQNPCMWSAIIPPGHMISYNVSPFLLQVTLSTKITTLLPVPFVMVTVQVYFRAVTGTTIFIYTQVFIFTIMYNGSLGLCYSFNIVQPISTG